MYRNLCLRSYFPLIASIFFSSSRFTHSIFLSLEFNVCSRAALRNSVMRSTTKRKKKSLRYSWPVYRVLFNVHICGFLYLNRTRNILQTITVTIHIQREAQIDDTATEIHTYRDTLWSIDTADSTHMYANSPHLMRSAEN